MTTPPEAVGHYRLIALIGEGGMGKVWRALDTRLGREVAIKLLPAIFASDPARLARFKREAHLLASLNHPGIAAIHEVEEDSTQSAESGVPALVMELVDGPTLADRIARGPIPFDEALPLVRQIAEALAYAHDHGVIHRDLKPSNIKVTPDGQIKILDFGLAKATAPESASHASSAPHLTTISEAPTQVGTLIGTAAYMAPEQVRGQNVDRRADIWAFGVVLYEMLAGERPFGGPSHSDTMAAVLRETPDWQRLPAAAQRLARLCLERDPKKRLGYIGDAMLLLEEPSSPAARRPQRWWLAGLAAFGVLCLGAGALAFRWLIPRAPRPVLRFAVAASGSTRLLAGFLAPNGRQLVLWSDATTTSPPRLWLRRLDHSRLQPLPGTEGAVGVSQAFWSPDSRQIGFYARGRLRLLTLASGNVRTLCPSNYLLGASWNRDGTIVFSSNGMLMRVPAAGGAAVPLHLHESPGIDLWPQFLPNGRQFLFVHVAAGNAFSAAATLGAAAITRLQHGGLFADGYLLYPRDGATWAQRFDPTRLRFLGAPRRLMQASPTSASDQGSLTYLNSGSGEREEMVWLDRKGRTVGTVGSLGSFADPAISPDGRKLAVIEHLSSFGDVWTADLQRGTMSRLTFSGWDSAPMWSPRGHRVLFSSLVQTAVAGRGVWAVHQRQADGVGAMTTVLGAKNAHLDAFTTLSPDGRYLLASANYSTFWEYPLDGGKPFPFVAGGFDVIRPAVSPDGHYVAYASDETGRFEIYVSTFPQLTERWQISNAGGNQPQWRADGKELYYLGPDRQLMSVSTDETPRGFSAGIPQPLFQLKHPLTDDSFRNSYAVAPDGRHFLAIERAGAAPAANVEVLIDWPELLKQRR